MIWEYLAFMNNAEVDVDVADFEHAQNSIGVVTGQATTAWMNHLGAQGWELFWVGSNGGMIFRRTATLPDSELLTEGLQYP